MANHPAITITRLDMQRLERLLDSLEDFTPAAEALEQELARANVIGHTEIAQDIVTMNSTVHCVEQATQKEYVVTVVYPQDAGASGTVSVLAPIGSALLGLSVGQSITWPTGTNKSLQLRVEKITYQPEAAGEFTL